MDPGVGIKNMTDLTLHEYRNIPKEDLQETLKQEATKVFGKDRTQKTIKPDIGMHLGFFQQLKGVSRRIFANSVGYFF
jgi:hypothetical protein